MKLTDVYANYEVTALEKTLGAAPTNNDNGTLLEKQAYFIVAGILAMIPEFSPQQHDNYYYIQ